MKFRHMWPAFLMALFAVTIFADVLRYHIRMCYGFSALFLIAYLVSKFNRFVLSPIIKWLFLAIFCYISSFLLTGREDMDTISHMIVPYFLAPFACAGMALYIMSTGDEKIRKWALVLPLVPIFISALLTIRAPLDSSRVFLANAMNNEMDFIAIENLTGGVMGYSAIHSLPFLLCGLVAAAKNVKSTKWILIFWMLASICVVTVLRSGYGACLLCTAIVLLFSIVRTKNRKMTLSLAIGAGGIILFLWKAGIVLSMLLAIQQYLPEGSIDGKISDLESQVKDSEGSEYWRDRVDLYAISFETFKKNPFLGGENSGGHSFFIDLLGQTGLIGVISFLIYYFTLYTMISRCLPSRNRWYFTIASISLFLLLLFKANGLTAQCFALFYLLPLLSLSDGRLLAEGCFNTRRFFHIRLEGLPWQG